ncbi:phosphonate C-P lyase system protein PhnH [Rhizobium halophytocola]|uniref:Alpha-D-ribose 1-methylphosphonate 5-triphosphate synthase subunit PhnH n=1 Tax=Rhizobium halophytocola TaxID=735519 RepID=A0ABS4E179_9HYPH|nr:phosphonate C-P lyase system protein PhnH [Rhizobium halophytocola]MBP1851703.1 alpha-D-ribose 1-methylphosphonate 5-triphosphate synthase subunit PhnH [Rhizobium halophytocola]
MSADMATLSGGFSEPVFEAQAVFRSVMDAMARPGTISTLETQVGPPPPLSKAAGALALTLCDHDTPVFLSPALLKSALPAWIGFHTGASVTREKAESRFAFFEAGVSIPPFGLFSTGTQEYPDRSTTVVIEVARLEGGPVLTLSGPGIKQTATLAPKGLPDPFLAYWAENQAIFPRGIDLVLTCGNRLACLPRTTKITIAEA